MCRRSQFPRDSTVQRIRYLATASLSGMRFGHHGAQRDFVRDLRKCKIRRYCMVSRSDYRGTPYHGTGSSHDETERGYLCGIWLTRYYTRFVCTGRGYNVTGIWYLDGTAKIDDHDGGTTRVGFYGIRPPRFLRVGRTERKYFEVYIEHQTIIPQLSHHYALSTSTKYTSSVP